MNFLLLLLLLIICIVSLNAEMPKNSATKRRLKILVYSPSLSYSHGQFLGAIADTLHEAGHEVHYLKYLFDQTLRHKNDTHLVKNTYLLEPSDTENGMNSFADMDMVKNAFDGTFQTLNFWEHIVKIVMRVTTKSCKDVIGSKEMLDRLAKEHFDVGIAEMYEPCNTAIFHRLGIKTKLAVSALPMVQFMARHYGVPTFASFVPNMMTPNPYPLESFYGRLLNFYNEFYDWYYIEKAYELEEDHLFKEAFGPDFPTGRELAKNVSLYFVNSNPFFEIQRPISNKIIHIGGIADGKVHKKEKLDEKSQQILDGAKQGAVLLSFGSITDTTQMSPQIRRAILLAFGRFPTVQFLFKLDKESARNESSLLASTPNVHTFEWVQQSAMLRHSNLRAFITHCGQNSLREAAKEGVPVLGVPLFGDQLYNSLLARKTGLGVYFDVTQLNGPRGEEMLFEALEKILHDPIYRQNAKLISKKLATSPFSAAETLIRWVEFAAEFPELNELDLPSDHEMGWFVYYSLDVISFTICMLLAMIWMAWKCAKLILNYIQVEIANLGAKNAKKDE